MFDDGGCPVLDKSGLPSQCLIDRLDLGLVVILSPFVLYKILALSKQAKTSTSSVSFHSELSIWLAMASTVTILLRWNLSSAIITVMQVMVIQLHRAQRHKVLVASPELLLFWVFRMFFELLRLSVRTSFLNLGAFIFVAATFLMELSSAPAHPTGFDDTTVFGRITASYLTPMLQVAKTKVLDSHEIPNIPSSLSAGECFSEYDRCLRSYPQENKYKVLFALLRAERVRLLMLLSADIGASLSSYLTPPILSLFLRSLSKYKSDTGVVYPCLYLAFGLGLAKILEASISNLKSIATNMCLQSMRTSLMQGIYHKSLRLEPGARLEWDSAKIMNLLNVDSSTVMRVYTPITTLISAPIGLTVLVIQLWLFLGVSTLAVVPVFALYVPIISWTTHRLIRRFPEIMAAKDRRAKSTMTVIRNIKSLKLYAWEAPYSKLVTSDRAFELDTQRKFLKVQTLQNTVSTMLDNILASSVFVAFLYFTGEALTPEIIFPVISMLSLISGPLFELPSAISSLGQVWTAQFRINNFFDAPEEDFMNYYHNKEIDNGDVVFENATLKWGANGPQAISDLSLTLQCGDLCCIVGKVGTGKTAILKALIGQMQISEGKLSISSEKIAYCAQEPWLQFRSVRENILFGLEFDEEFYNQVLDACELVQDIASLDNGDKTEIGEKGFRLSGGQKARVALARAVYSRAKVVVLDDVFSAVDDNVGSKLLHRLFSPKGLLCDRTIILATNSGRPLRFASRLICLGDERITYNGEANSKAEKFLESTTSGLDSGSPLPPDNFDRTSEIGVSKAPPAHMAKCSYSPPRPSEGEMFPDTPMLSVFTRFLKTAGFDVTCISLSTMLLSVVMPNLITVWLTIWSDKDLAGLWASRSYVSVYLILTFFTGVAIFFSNFYYYGSLVYRASRRLHDDMLSTVIRAPMSFFEKTPLGQVMNRFTGDIGSVDGKLPETMYGFMRNILFVTAALVITVAGAPLVLFVLLPMLPKYDSYRRLFVPGTRQLEKISSTSRGPILSHVEESIRGVATISPLALRPLFIESNEMRSDFWIHATFIRSSLRGWLEFRVNAMSALLTLTAGLTVIPLIRWWAIGVAGIVLQSVQLAASRLSWIIQSWTDLEVSAVAAERIYLYTDMSTEAPSVTSLRPSPHWPEHGAVELDDLCARYSPDRPDVLHNISVSIRSGEKIGVVGRTGAGKTTLSVMLFRILEATSGKISIDGLDISNIGLYDLRSRLAIIPQDAQIFKGTLRSNLDPLSEVDDLRLWQVLDICHLRDKFERGPGLDAAIADGGEDISRGQSQLICLGRALLRPTKVLIMDEATASVDAKTDSLVQETIQKQFADHTVVTIAHRINTVMNYDRILVLSQGEIVEFDSPQNLLRAKGAFWHLAQSYKGN